jgi:hypothetical protein
MANLGEITEIINATECTLEIRTGSGTSDVYGLLQDLDIHIGRIENRHATTDGLIYTYGKGDNFFTGKIILTGPELDGTAWTSASAFASFNELTQTDSNGDLNTINWLIHANPVDSGATDKYLQATGVLRDYDIRKTSEGVVEISIFVRITGDTITINDTIV